MPLVNTVTEDFGGGIYRGRKAPPNTAYDLVNALIDDEGQPFRRGGSAYYSASAAPAAARRVFVAYMRAVAANRVLLTTAASRYVLDDTLAPVFSGNSLIDSRPAASGNYLAFAYGANTLILYAGSRKSSYSTGTVTVTNGSATVAGSGTSWAANSDAGMILTVGSTRAVVKSVDTDTQITLTDVWTGSTVAGSAYSLGVTVSLGFSFLQGADRAFVVAAGQRLLFCIGNRVYYTPRNDPPALTSTDYHELPANAVIVGAEGRGDAADIFTTVGQWRISNLSLDDVDAFGNVQHTVEQVNKDVILWDDYGIAGHSGGLVLPCIDDIFLAGPDFSLTPITGRIRPLYRDYVQAGYQPGQAAVHRSHYFLPILNGTDLVDTLVCRLDRDAAFTRWAGHAASPAYATLIEESAREPKLLGLAGARVTDLTDCFNPGEGNSEDADDTTSDFVLESRDFLTGASQPGFVNRFRARYELDGDATVTPAFSSDQDGDVFTEMAERGEQGGETGWGESDGSKYQWAVVGKKRDRIRFRLTVSGSCVSFVLRSVEWLMRPSGKQ